MRKRLLVLALSCLVAVYTLTPGLRAQQADGTGSGLSISPTRTELRINPGESDVVRLNLRNVTGGDILAKAYINDFESDNETGEPKINLDENNDNPASIRSFLSGVEDVSLASGAEETFDIQVNVPSDAAPGAYYGIVRYAAVPVGNDAPEPGQVSLTASVASIILVEVAGDILEQVELNNVFVYDEGKAGSFFIGKPDQVGVEVANKGNGFAKPFGTVTLHNPFGSQVSSYELNGANPRANVLPNTSRTFKDDLNGVNWPGRYQVTASVSFGNGGEVLVMKKSFWYVPLWSIVAFLVLIVAVTLAVLRLRGHLSGIKHRRK